MYYEDEGKISLKGTSMKRLVLALYAQFRVSAEFEGFMDDRNGIRHTAHLPVETYYCEEIYGIGVNLPCG